MASLTLQDRLSSLYASLPEARDRFDRVADYFGSTQGAWDLFRVVDHALEWVRLSSLTHSTRALTTKISRSVSLAGTSLSIPTVFSDANALRKKVSAFSEARSDKSDSRDPKVLQAGKDCLISGIGLTNTVFQAILFAHEAKLVNLGKKLPIINFIHQTTWLAVDTAGLLSEAYEFSSNFQKSSDEARRSLSAIAQNVFSVAIAAIVLVGTVFGPETIEAATPVVLILSTGWLIAKLLTSSYQQVLDDQKALDNRKVIEDLTRSPNG